MKSVVMRDLRDYVRKYWGLIAASMAAMLICFGYLVFVATSALIRKS